MRMPRGEDREASGSSQDLGGGKGPPGCAYWKAATQDRDAGYSNDLL